MISSRHLTIFKALLLSAALPALLLLATMFFSERIMVEKLLTTLAMPTGMIWLSLWSLLCFALVFRVRYFGVLILVMWLGFTAITSPLTAYFFAWRLERQVADIDIETLPSLSAVVVLGGGASESPRGRAAVASAGERVLLGARLFHAGKTPILVTTGQAIESLRRTRGNLVERDGAELTQEIWRALRVPENAIQTLGGRNTREEMRAIAAWKANLPEDSEIGLVTSAWHMPRALRLAEKEGLKFVPLPADFIAGQPPVHFIELLPSGGAVGKFEMVLKEYLAWLVGR